MSSELSALPWVLAGVVLLALVIGYFACREPERPVKRWAWKGSVK